MMAEQSALVGLAVDVSDSMRSSIRNDTGDPASRFDAVRAAFDTLADRAAPLLGHHQSAAGRQGLRVDVFGYAFGLRDSSVPVADLLSLLRLGAETEAPAAADPVAELAAIAAQHGRAGWGEWIRTQLAADEAATIVANLRRSPGLVAAIANRLPGLSADEIRHATMLTQTPEVGSADAGDDRSRKGLFRRASDGLRFGRSIRNDDVSPLRVSLQVARSGGLERMRRRIGEAEELIRKLGAREYSMADLIALFPDEATEQLGAALDRAGDTTMRVEEVAALFGSRAATAGSMEAFVYGSTPMCAAMSAVQQRFERELANRSDSVDPTLVIVSDGQPTDGDPRPTVESMRASGITVVSCYVTDHDVQEPRTLPAKPGRRWDPGARLMFECASPVTAGSAPAAYLRSRGWKIPRRARLFTQANHSTVVAEFIRAAMAR
ncbi:VWA domain-containing protein [Micromonospora sp. WMMD1102]|uniref:VWA domain-containing protein n=1 Tax=Micromonospora sp. WMMD1102 TaxID=3016105 RepID=UPI0024156485|nr:VWA domain-containing protein [Micromonospora sp. WMMD1102]MDG4791783.1 VWA domain-containing protein [Micromonospora sp. WMMD1102]